MLEHIFVELTCTSKKGKMEWMSACMQEIISVVDESTCTMTDISKRTGIRREHVCRYLDLAEDYGLVERKVDKHDNRRKIVSLTPRGVRICELLMEWIRIQL